MSEHQAFVAEEGARIGRWRLCELLGAGGFGTTWSVTDETGSLAALKILTEPPGNELRALRQGHLGLVRKGPEAHVGDEERDLEP